MSGRTEGLTEAERRDLALARHGRLALTDDQIATVERIVAARESAAATRARADALNAAADAIQALHPGEVKNSVIFLRDRAAHIARGDA